MFSLFKRKHSLLESGVLRGATDVHCHVLPGVDDGARTADDSLALLRFMEREIGLAAVWFTPHVAEDLPNTAAGLESRFRAFKDSYTGGLSLHLAAEYMLDEGFPARLHTAPLPVGKNRHLLVETSYMCAPMGMEDMLQEVWRAGFTPLLAHPERYVYMDERGYKSLKDRGCAFQLNLLSLSGYYGERPRVYAAKLLDWGMYNHVGTDLHHLRGYRPMLQAMKVTSAQLAAIERLADNNRRL